MTIQRTIEEAYKSAFKSNDHPVISALRMLKSAIKNHEIEIGRELTDEETVVLISREVKKRRDAAAQYELGHRPELAQHEQDDIAAYAKYMPAQLTDQELQAIVEEAITSTGASEAKDLGKVMGAVMAKVRGRADGTTVQKIVRQRLGA
jgi:hypothetical protein